MNKHLAFLLVIVGSTAFAADKGTCLDLARAGMMYGEQENICKFKGNLKEEFKALYAANECNKTITPADLNQAAKEVLGGMRSEYAQSGKTVFCKSSRESYADGKKELQKQKESYIKGL